MRGIVIVVLCVVCFVVLGSEVRGVSTSNDGLPSSIRATLAGSSCAGGVCHVPVEVRVEKAVVAEKTKAVAKNVVAKAEEAVELGKGRLKKLIGRIIHRRGR